MKTSLTDILVNALVGKTIKLYKVIDKQHNPEGVSYYLADKGFLSHSKKCEIIGEIHGTIESLETQDCGYEGDNYEFIIVDENGVIMNVHGLHTITANVEILN
jgi:hypothetical protein